jgi:hypothetical protein
MLSKECDRCGARGQFSTVVVPFVGGYSHVDFCDNCRGRFDKLVRAFMRSTGKVMKLIGDRRA